MCERELGRAEIGSTRQGRSGEEWFYIFRTPGGTSSIDYLHRDLQWYSFIWKDEALLNRDEADELLVTYTAAQAMLTIQPKEVN